MGELGICEDCVHARDAVAVHEQLVEARGCTDRQAGVQFHDEPQLLDVGVGEWRYAYFADPDGLYVSLVEARY